MMMMMMMKQVSKDVVTVGCWSYTGNIQQQHLQSSIQKYQSQQQVGGRGIVFLVLSPVGTPGM